jgi:hypothetical protein
LFVFVISFGLGYNRLWVPLTPEARGGDVGSGWS